MRPTARNTVMPTEKTDAGVHAPIHCTNGKNDTASPCEYEPRTQLHSPAAARTYVDHIAKEERLGDDSQRSGVVLLPAAHELEAAHRDHGAEPVGAMMVMLLLLSHWV
jgi:hypothetical protein